MGVGSGEFGSTLPNAVTRGSLVGCPCETTVNPLVPGGSWNCTVSPTWWTPRASVRPSAGGAGAYVLWTMGCVHAVNSATSMFPPLIATGRFGQLTAAAGAAAGARQTFPALPAVPQTSPAGQPSPEAHAGRQKSPVDSWTQTLPEAHDPPLEHEAAHTPPGKSALSKQVRPLAQPGLQLAEPRSVPEHPIPSVASTTRRHDRVRTRSGA